MAAGCAAFQPTEEPIPTRWHDNRAQDGRSDTLLVILRGARDSLDDIFDSGVVAELEEAGLDWDVVAVDAHLGYYREKSMLDRVEADVLAAARERGYERFWLTGPSLGGFGSLYYWCRQRDDDIEGIIAIAPFMGEEAVLEHIRDAGGPREWEPDPEVGAIHERQLWSCLRSPPDYPPMWLAYGSRDRMAPGNDLFARVLPEERVLRSDGRHRWVDWVPLWRRIFRQIAANGDATTRSAD